MTSTENPDKSQQQETLSGRIPAFFHVLGPANMPRRLIGHIAMTCLVVLVIVASHNATVHDSLEAFSLDKERNLVPEQSASQTPSTLDVLVKGVAPYTDQVNRPKQDVIAHTVRDGESVETIALHYNISAKTIIWSNDLADEARIQAGQELKILPVSGVLHEVSAGETLEDVAAKYLSDVDSIIEFNRITDPDNLMPGDQLVIPGGSKLAPQIDEGSPDAVQTGVSKSQAQAAAEAATKLKPLDQPRAEPEPVREPEPAPEQEPEPTALKPFIYIVKGGDTLSIIAGKFGISTESIVWANDLDGDMIHIGEELTIPPVSGVIYEVEEGDAVHAIADRYGSSSTEIIKVNGLAPPNYTIVPGQILVVPGGEPPPPPPPPQRVVHVVNEGESVAAIAGRYSVNPLSIINYNGLPRPYTIWPGQRLVIPGGAVPSASQVARQPSAAERAVVASAADSAGPSLASSIIGIASKYLGFPYVWGGSTPGVGFDCSGYTWWIFREVGRPLPRDLWGQLQAGQRVDYDSLQVGDMIFFVNTYQPGLSHNGLYIGNGQFIHAASENTGVIISSLSNPYWGNRYYAASRHW